MQIALIIDKLFLKLEKLENVPNIIQGISIALLTILVPLAIAIILEIYQKRKSPEKEFAALDLLVLLDDIVKVKRLIVIVFCIFTPLFFWDILSGELRLLILLIFVVSISILSHIIFQVYSWVKGDKWEFRFAYLKKTRHKNDDLFKVWSSVWNVSNIPYFREKQLFNIFSSCCNELWNNEKKRFTFQELISIFSETIDNRSIRFLKHNKNFHTVIFNWRYIAWQEKNYNKNENPAHEYSFFILDDLFKHIEIKLMKKDICIFLKTFKNHVEKIKDEEYRRNILLPFYNIFFHNIIEVFNTKFRWNNCFPKEWKITKTNFNKNSIARITLDEFFRFYKWRRRFREKVYDPYLEELSYNLFPTVDPINWALILIFAFVDSENRVKSTLEQKQNFGNYGRSYSTSKSNNITKIKKNEEKKTIELALEIFPEIFSKENLQKYIKQLESKTYSSNTSKENKREKLHYFFKEMLKLKESND